MPIYTHIIELIQTSRRTARYRKGGPAADCHHLRAFSPQRERGNYSIATITAFSMGSLNGTVIFNKPFS